MKLIPLAALALASLAPPVAADASPKLSRGQAIAVARRFCRAVGEPVSEAGRAVFPAPLQPRDARFAFYLPVWKVTFPGQAEVDVVDADRRISQYFHLKITAFPNDWSPQIARRNPLVGPARARQLSARYLKAAGIDASELRFDSAAVVDELHPAMPSRPSYSVTWGRIRGSRKLPNQHAGLTLDGPTGRLQGFIAVFTTPPGSPAAKRRARRR